MAEPTATCGLNGQCSGARSCALYAAATPCSDAFCDAGVLNLVDACDGAGHCVDAGLQSCLPYACEAGACRLACTLDAQCQQGFECSGGQCVGSLGTTCGLDADCASGACADGVCCDTPCDGTCESCGVGGFEGTCTALAEGTDPDDECAASAATSCGTTGQCSGQRSCELWPATTVCRPAAGPCDVLEQCDGDGACLPDLKSTAPCRAAAGPCDVAESCDGVGDQCPTDELRSTDTVCRDAVDVCDVTEHCTGFSATCPDDLFAPPVVVCRDAAGACDVDDACTGASAACPQDAKSTDVCRAAHGPCDTAEYCSGVSNDCPGDAFLPASVVCRTSEGECDPAEYCPGAGAACPDDVLESEGAPCSDDGNACTIDLCDGATAACPRAPAPAGVVCRPASDACDVVDACDGASPVCPVDTVRELGAPCVDDGELCTADQCDGVGKACAHPAGNTGLVCRASAGDCDPAETCNGVLTTCPDDTLQATGTICRASAGECDEAETCSGTSAACPAEGFKPEGTACTDDGSVCSTDLCTGLGPICQHAPGNVGVQCRASAGDCDVAEACDGLDVACPADQFLPATAVCRASAGGCDRVESCTGDGPSCPTDVVQALGEPCPDDDNACTVESCDGFSVTCHHKAGNGGPICRPAVDECDVVERCTGTASECPDDAIYAPDSPCTDDGQICTSDTCDGTTTVCHHQPGNAGLVCRATAGGCDVQEVCDGVAGACPSDVLLPADTICRPSEGVCDLVEACSGVDAACPDDAKKATGVACSDDGNPCTEDVCDGVVNACQHRVGNRGNVCRPAADTCDAVETCTGVSGVCPDDTFLPVGTVCRPAATECDVPETCLGGTWACPTNQFSPLGAPCNENDSSCDGAGQCLGAPVAYRSGIVLPPRVAADGKALALALLTMRNTDGQPVANKRVQFSAVGAQVFDPTGQGGLVRTNLYGQATVFVSSSTIGEATVLATWAGGLEVVTGTLTFVSPVPSATKAVAVPHGTVRVSAADDGVLLDDLHGYPVETLPLGLPAGTDMPLGMRAFTVLLPAGQTEANIHVEMVARIPGSHKLWMYAPTADDRRPHWVDVTFSEYVTNLKDEDPSYDIRLVDGGFGDADGVVNGVIVDPQGISNNPSDIPTLDQWATLLLALALLAYGVRRLSVAKGSRAA